MDVFKSTTMDSLSNDLLSMNLNTEITKITISYLPNEIISYIIDKSLIWDGDNFGYDYYDVLGKLRLICRNWNDIICRTSRLWRYIFFSDAFIKHIEKSVNDNDDILCVQMARNLKMVLYIYYLSNRYQKYIDIILNRYQSRLDAIFIDKSLMFDTKLELINSINRNPNVIKRIIFNGLNNISRGRKNIPSNFKRLFVPFVDYFYCEFEDEIFQIVDLKNVKTLKIMNFNNCNKLLKGLNTCNELTHLTLIHYYFCFENVLSYSMAWVDNIKDLPYAILENLDSLHFNVFKDMRGNAQNRHRIQAFELLDRLKIPNVRKLFIDQFTSRYTIPDCKVESLHIKSSEFVYVEFKMYLYEKIKKYKDTLEVVTLECDNEDMAKNYKSLCKFCRKCNSLIYSICNGCGKKQIWRRPNCETCSRELSINNDVRENKSILIDLKDTLLTDKVCKKVYTITCISGCLYTDVTKRTMCYP